MNNTTILTLVAKDKDFANKQEATSQRLPKCIKTISNRPL